MHSAVELTEREYTKNFLLALLDEIREIKEAPNDIVEYIDALHFILTLANIYDVNLFDNPEYFKKVDYVADRLFINTMIVARASRTFKHWSKATITSDDVEIIAFRLNEMYWMISSVCKQLGYDMVEEYDKKYQINIDRQNNGY